MIRDSHTKISEDVIFRSTMPASHNPTDGLSRSLVRSLSPLALYDLEKFDAPTRRIQHDEALTSISGRTQRRYSRDLGG